ncbi:MAG: peptidase [Hydrocarboniphaga sp.]|uniref:hypothetical protein n=1 Tax=Hydrocarboniphaga sp. TaxID=2033016 RepID=UPI0026066C49|nr:hypothetical protein [Hydrocarboniphaga sp.]MDB5969829.1 peptidase [Hydrocarboniphaga sp.]
MIKITGTALLCAGLCVGSILPATAGDATSGAASDSSTASQYDQALLSAKGTYLGIVSHDNGAKILSVVNLKTMKPTRSLKFTSDHSIEGVWWASDDKLVVSKTGDFDDSQSGELYAFDAEGSGTTYLYGRNGDAHTGTHLGGAKQEGGIALMVDPLPLDPNHILVVILRSEPAFQLAEIDLATATRRTVGSANYSWFRTHRTTGGLRTPAGQIATDDAGRPRYAIAVRPIVLKPSDEFVELIPNGDRWEPVENSGTDEHTELLGVSANGATAYLIRSPDGCLIARDLTNATVRVVACDEPLTRGNIVFARAGGAPIVVGYKGNHPPVFLEPDSFEAKAYRSLQKSFGNQNLRVMSSTPDSHKLIVEVSGKDKPGELYLIDLDAKKAEFLLSKQPGNDAPAEPAKPSAAN